MSDDSPRATRRSAQDVYPIKSVVHHHVITRDNVDHFYPNDALLGVSTYAGY